MATRLHTKIGYTAVFNGKKVEKYQPTTKGRVISFAKHNFRKSGTIYIKVSYGSGIENSGTYPNYSDFKKALDQFTEPALLKYIYSSEW